MGAGTGIQGITAALKGCDVTFSDIDTKAIECSRYNAAANGVEGNFIVSDLFSNVKERFNTIIFNPPYLISSEYKNTALDGGTNGREIIDRFIQTYKDHVLPKHIVLLVESSFNSYEKNVKTLKAKVVAKEHYFFEDVVLLSFL